MLTKESDIVLYVLIGSIVLFFLVLLVVGGVSFYNRFLRELQDINNEIRRTRGEERQHWMRKRRRLWLSLIPFIKY